MAVVRFLNCEKWISEFSFAALSRALTLHFWLLAAFSITLVNDLTSMLNSATACSFGLFNCSDPTNLQD